MLLARRATFCRLRAGGAEEQPPCILKLASSKQTGLWAFYLFIRSVPFALSSVSLNWSLLSFWSENFMLN